MEATTPLPLSAPFRAVRLQDFNKGPRRGGGRSLRGGGWGECVGRGRGGREKRAGRGDRVGVQLRQVPGLDGVVAAPGIEALAVEAEAHGADQRVMAAKA